MEGWLQVEGPVSGWIFDDINNRAMFERFPPHWQSSSVVYGLASDTNGFTAFGWTANGSEEVMLASSDGTHWRTSETPSAAWGRAIANGPAGWLMAGTVDSQGATRTTVWQSADGESWDRLGALPPTMTDGITALAGSPAGYVLLTDASRSGAAGVWFSADGLLWTERPLAEMRTDMGMRLAATPLGFFIWGLNNPISEGDGAFSTDGWTWAEADPIGPGQILDVAADGDHLLAVGRGPGGTRMWKGTIEGAQLTWSSDNTAPFRSATVGRLLTDGERAIVLGWDRATEMPLWWERDGLSWQRHTMPGSFGALPLYAVAGAKGVVAVGQEASAGGRTPVFWHLGDGVTWEREPSPAMPAPAPPTTQTCGPKPDDLLALISADNVWTAVCYGDVPITFRGWSVACDGCYYSSPGIWKPKWLSQPADERVIHLAPVESGDWGYLDGVLHPSVRGPTPPLSRWLEVTGHFDDPEAASCRWTPTLVDEYWYTGSYDTIAACRGRFVVTAIRPVKGP